MKYAVLLGLLIFAPGILAQPPKQGNAPARRSVVSKPKPKPTPTPTPLSEKEQFDKASALELASDRVTALEKFLAAFPESENRAAAVDLLMSSRGLIAEEKLLAGDSVEAVKLFRLIVAEAPTPVPDALFNESIAKIPMTLFRRGQREVAFELASEIEKKVENNTAQLLEIANFYLGVENGGEAMRVAAIAVAKDPASPAVYRTLALAHRINFDLEESATAYAKSLELDPASLTAKRGLAEMRRALGRSDEAATLYRELLSKNETDVVSRNGLILSLFESGKRAEAEAELASALEKTPGNFVLMAGAAYWYASRGIGAKAVELGEKALAKEPRYIWSHIALARGLMAEGKPVAAEQVLVKARAYGNFPTLEYELASARAAAGFYREAVEDLSRHFVVSGGGVKTHLGGRVQREERSFYDLVAYERKASIFAAAPADTTGNSEVLRALLDLDQKANAASPVDADVAAAADAFVKGSDKMKLHRQIYAANLLLLKRVAIPKVVEIVKGATGTTDVGLEVPAAGAAVMASELYEARSAAFRKGEFLIVPDVPRQTLSAILRGRIEELAGWALYQQGSYADAAIRLRRAITVMPDKSAWWRSSMWRLGAALAAEGKDAEALNAYIDSYKTDKPDFGKYAVVETLYKKVHGSTEGLEAKIGPERVATIPAAPNVIQPVATPSATPAEETSGNAQSPSAESAANPAAKPAASPEAALSESLKSEAEKAVPAVARPVSIEQPKPEPVADDQDKAKALAARPTALNVEPTPQPAPAETDKPKDTTVVPAVTTTEATERDKPAEKPPETNRTETSLAENSIAARTTGNSPSQGSKPLFEPIIITIPNSKAAKTSSPSDTSKQGGTEQNKAEAEKTSDEKSGADRTNARARVIEGQEVKVSEPETCSIGLSQEAVSVINNGGKVGLLVHVEGKGDIKDLTAVSSSPKDVEIVMEPEISGMPERRFFVIKSLSTSLGMFQINFVMPCGKKDLSVSVR